VEYHFSWDPVKARENRRKHRVPFEDAATVFRDPRALTIYDDEHSEGEDRWLTMGISAARGLLVVSHTFDQTDSDNAYVRVISAWKADAQETRQYRELP